MQQPWTFNKANQISMMARKDYAMRSICNHKGEAFEQGKCSQVTRERSSESMGLIYETQIKCCRGPLAFSGMPLGLKLGQNGTLETVLFLLCSTSWNRTENNSGGSPLLV
jgi:hypothetical protein